MRIATKPSMLNWAIERSLKGRVGLLNKFPKLEEWLVGQSNPTIKQLEDFARATYVSVATLLLDKPPNEQLPIADFRTFADEARPKISPHLLDAIYDCQQKQIWYEEYCRLQQFPQLPFVNIYTTSDSPLKAAKSLSDYFDFHTLLYNSWTDALAKRRQAIENKNILVMISGVVKGNTHRPLNAKDFRGFALVDEYAPLIFINGKDTEAAKSFTIMHELAHIALGKSGVSDCEINPEPSHATENWCNQVAAQILVPQQSLLQRYSPQASVADNMNTLANKYKVSTLVILRRMKDLNCITEQQYWDEYHLEKEKIENILLKKPKSNGGNYYNAKPVAISKRFMRALAESTLEGFTLYRDALQLSNIKKIHTFGKLASQLL